jgi:hypothetical protein
MYNWRPGGTGLGWTWTRLGNKAGLWLYLFRLCRLWIVRCIRFHSQVTDLLVLSIYLLMGAGRLVSLLSWVPALFGPAFYVVIYILGWGGLSITLRPGLQCWGLRVRAWTGTWTPWQEWNGLILLVPGVQARRVFSGHPAGHIHSRIVVNLTVWHDYNLAS